jgi:hypothetical protein
MVGIHFAKKGKTIIRKVAFPAENEPLISEVL